MSQQVSSRRSPPSVFQKLRNIISNIFASPPPDDSEGSSKLKPTGIVADLRSQGQRIPENLSLLLDFLEASTEGKLIDDKSYTVEKIIKLAASLPPTSVNQANITGSLIKSLWDVLDHPPLSYASQEYRYRSADGSGNNILFPHIGKAGAPYAKSVVPRTVLPANLPDAGVLFDTLFARDKVTEHPAQMSSMLFYLATIIIHDAFRTAPNDSTLSNTSSYLDLAPLYGNNQGEQDSVRTGTAGLLKADTFCEPRILGFPPGVGAFLICFNRYHNYVVSTLAQINEGGRFTRPAGEPIPRPVKPRPLGKDAADEQKAEYEKAKKAYDEAYQKYKPWAQYDEDLFQTGRLITCGLYVNIILNDYVKSILGFQFTDSSWTLDPRTDHGGAAKACGNQVSLEFNLLYRWHSCISARDEQWTKDFYQDQFKVSNPEKLTPDELKGYLKEWGHSIPVEPEKRTFGGMKRGADGRFNEKELVQHLESSVDDLAGSFGARNIPKVMRAVEIMGIEQARKWKTATLNEFRKFCHLKPYESFEDINSDPHVANGLRAFYGNPDLVEMYPGMLAEEAKMRMEPGSGLCASFTISKAILSDAVALVRGDRYYTVDYNVGNLTNWGYTEVSSDPKLFEGRVLYKLFMKALPQWYRGNSVYAIYPFTLPSEMRRVLKGFKKDQDFDFTRPSETYTHHPIPILRYNAVKQVLSDKEKYNVPWGAHIKEFLGREVMLSGDKPLNTQLRGELKEDLFAPKNGLDQIREFYEATTEEFLKSKSFKLGNYYQVDAVRDIGNLVHARFAAQLFDLPLKDQHGKPTEQDLYGAFALLFAWVFLDLDTAKHFQLRKKALGAVKKFEPVIRLKCEEVKAAGTLHGLPKDRNGASKSLMADYGKHMLSRMLQQRGVDDVVATAAVVCGASVANQAQGFAQALDLLFTDKYIHHWPTIQKLAQDNSSEAFAQLTKYAWEVSRLASAAAGLFRTATVSETIQDGPQRSVPIHPGDNIFVDFKHASIDPEVFPNPYEINLNRPVENYIHFGWGAHSCLGAPIVVTALAAMLRVFAKCEGLRRAPGGQGQIKSVDIMGGGFKAFLTEDWSALTPFPANMKVHFNALPA